MVDGGNGMTLDGEPLGGEAPSAEQPADEYAIVEIFGHRRHAGRIMEVERFGAKMLRVDVPKDGDFANGYVSHFYGGASIFSLTGTDLESVRSANKPRHPVFHISLPAPADEDPDGDTREADIDDDDLIF